MKTKEYESHMEKKEMVLTQKTTIKIISKKDFDIYEKELEDGDRIIITEQVKEIEKK